MNGQNDNDGDEEYSSTCLLDDEDATFHIGVSNMNIANDSVDVDGDSANPEPLQHFTQMYPFIKGILLGSTLSRPTTLCILKINSVHCQVNFISIWLHTVDIQITIFGWEIL